ncbi:MAG: hypothetical protein LUG66_01520 [Clostridiales bacterium]|nr:hypothetical protein [Clostridiales bacterium]
MITRECLKKGNTVLLCGKSNNEIFKRTFTVIRRLNGEGSSAVCYEAYYEPGRKGILKEFYPAEPEKSYGLKRNKNNRQLICQTGLNEARESFLKAERKYIEPYLLLLETKNNDKDNVLATFVPDFEIYHGCDDEGNIIGTTYIWTPQPEAETFDKICTEIHKHPAKDPEHKLVIALKAIYSLTNCVCALHKLGIFHRDINPNNFGFLKREDKLLTEYLSMFDVNTLCSAYDSGDEIVRTEGYCEPEAFKSETGINRANNKTDIYSIGASLFTAVIVSDEVKENNYHYKAEYYDRLEEMVDSSKLIKASESNSHPRLKEALTRIFQKCLCERSGRYENCEELAEELDKALYYAVPAEAAAKGYLDGKWVYTELEKSLDKNKEKNSYLSMQYHLYKHPLYKCVKDDEKTINVLLFGFGSYGQKFLNACLQAGQILGKELNVTVVSNNETDKDIYLKDKPELAEFFNIDGSLSEKEDSYGSVAFEKAELANNSSVSRSAVLQNVIYEHYDNKRPHYIFIALGKDAVNYAEAKACKKAAETFEMDCVISYACEKTEPSAADTAPIYPVYVNGDIKKSELYPEIERMAFNTHLIWEKNINVDYKPIKDNFNKPYNHDSSVSSVLSIKYKLYSIGIDLDRLSFNEAALRFSEEVIEKNDIEKKNNLIWIEHRRWVAEKLCDGWSRMKNLEDCKGKDTKDKIHKRHICILKSRPDQKLDDEYEADNFEKWDSASEGELQQLDELDRMSVELHRMYKRRAEGVSRQNSLNGDIIMSIRSFIEGHRKAFAAFQEWFSCMKDIVGSDGHNSAYNVKQKVYSYKGLKESFLNSLDTLTAESKKAVKGQVEAFDAVFYPVLACTEYHSWKNEDTKIINSIPFILTYTEEAYLAIPYACGDKYNTLSDVSFGNVAAATPVNPERIIYLYLIEEKQDVKNLLDSLPGVISYMNKKKFRAAVDFLLMYTGNTANSVNQEFLQELKKTGGGKIRTIKTIMLDEPEDAPAEAEAYLKKRSKGKKLFAVEKNLTNLSSMMRVGRVYKKFPSYRFVSKSMRFEDLFNCDMLRFLRKDSFITVSDMLAFQCSLSDSSNNPEFFRDYNRLFTMYKQKTRAWKSLCDKLLSYSEKNDVAAVFKKDPRNKKSIVQNYSFRRPAFCSRGAAKIIDFLKTKEIIEEGSCVKSYLSDSCEIIIKDPYGYAEEFESLFSREDILINHSGISFSYNKNREACVVFENLKVSGLKLDKDRKKEHLELLNFFREINYIMNYKELDGTVSFTYAGSKIKELLTTAGKILEIYIYHKVMESGEFNDVVCSHEINWEETDVKSEFDCIITKGFSSLFIECKARPYIEQDFYFKLNGLMRKFGINAKAVLIADTMEKDSRDNALNNTMQRKRGDMIDVVTVYNRRDIANIGDTLLKLIKEDF